MKVKGNLHGPNVHLWPIVLPGEQLGSSVGRAATLSAEGVRISQDGSNITEAEI